MGVTLFACHAPGIQVRGFTFNLLRADPENGGMEMRFATLLRSSVAFYSPGI
jgi:hypothetical protein